MNDACTERKIPTLGCLCSLCALIVFSIVWCLGVPHSNLWQMFIGNIFLMHAVNFTFLYFSLLLGEGWLGQLGYYSACLTCIPVVYV